MFPVIPVAVLAALLWWFSRGAQAAGPELRYFKKEEFGPWWPLMDHGALLKLDAFRHELGYPVTISPAPGALGRPSLGGESVNEEEASSESRHNWIRYGRVMAMDVLPDPPGGATPEERRRWFEVAKRVGFTGIGIYPHWSPRPGMHLDVRTDRPEGQPATWAGLPGVDGKQNYVAISKAFV